MMKRRRENEKKEEEEVMNVHYAQFREMKGMEVIREFVIFLAALNGRAYQTRFKSEQSIPPHLVCCYILYNFVCFTHTIATLRWIDL